MSFDHWWYSCLLTPEQEDELEPLFAAADRKAVLSPEQQEALRSWEGHPDSFTHQRMRETSGEEQAELGRRYNRFVWAFNLPGYDELGIEVTKYLSDDTCSRFISIRRCSPGAVLWQALGRERAERLPGRMGNLFLRASQVDAALKQAEQVLADLDIPEAVRRGKTLAYDNDDGDVEGVITHLRDGLRDAATRGMGFMAVARPQI